MSKIKVLQLHPDYNIKNIDISDLGEQIFKGLPREQYATVNGFLSGRPNADQSVSCADESVYFEFTRKQLKGLRLRVLWKLYQYLKKEQFDVVICNRYKPVNLLLTLSRLIKTPLCVGIVHGVGDYDRSYRRRQVRKRLSSNWKFVAVSDAVKNYLFDLKTGFNDENTVTITNAIDTEKAEKIILDKKTAREKLGLDQSIQIIGAVGRLVPLKGHANLIKAFSTIHQGYPNTHLVIIGDGREKSNLERLVESLALQGRVHLLGFQPDAIKFAKTFDIWVLPSFEEGLSLALLEGMCAKAPIIASNIPAMLPLIEGAGGIAIDPYKVDELSEALLEYLNKTDHERELLGEKAYKYLISNHSISVYREKYLRLIETGLNQNE